MKLPNWFLTGIMAFVVLIWGASVLYGFTHPDFKTPDALTAAFSAIVGLVLAQAGRQVSKNRREDNDDDKKDDKSNGNGQS